MSLVRRGILPATQIVPSSPWLVPVDALSSEPVRLRVHQVIARRPKIYEDYQYDKVVRHSGKIFPFALCVPAWTNSHTER